MPPRLPKPPPLHTGLSKGDIAGIAVGSVAGAALVAGLAFWLFCRRRRSRKPKEPETTANELAGGDERKELGTGQQRSQVERSQRVELSQDAAKKQELGGPELYEMWADPNVPEMGTGVRKQW